MTVVLDTNVVVAALVANGLCREVFRRAARRRALVTAPALLDELEATLNRKFIVTGRTSAFLRMLRTQVRLVEPTRLASPICRDPDDDVVLAAAVAGGADRIVTGDRDLLDLGVYEGIQIVTPRQFLEWLDRGPGRSRSAR